MKRQFSLNPSLGGIWSWSDSEFTEWECIKDGLNPSLGGIWSWSSTKKDYLPPRR